MFDSGHAFESIRATVRSCESMADCADATLARTLEQLHLVRRELDAIENETLRVFDARGVSDTLTGLKTKAWMSREFGESPISAHHRLKVARTLDAMLPATEAALAAGSVSFDHAKAMANAVKPRIAAEFARFEAPLLELAPVMEFNRWQAEVEGVAAMLDQDGNYDPSADMDNNKLTLRPVGHEAVVKGTLVGDIRVLVEQALAAFTDRQFEQWSKDVENSGGLIDMPSQATLRALALAEMCAIAMGSGQPAGCHRVEATLVLSSADLDTAYDTNQHAHPRNALGPLLCDLDIAPVVINILGQPVDLGRSERFVNRAQRRGLNARDGGCTFPGCGCMPERCDAHHVIAWIDGGTTDLQGLTLLCRHHHGVVHRLGWSAAIDAQGRTWFTTPKGERLAGQQHHRRLSTALE